MFSYLYNSFFYSIIYIHYATFYNDQKYKKTHGNTYISLSFKYCASQVTFLRPLTLRQSHMTKKNKHFFLNMRPSRHILPIEKLF